MTLQDRLIELAARWTSPQFSLFGVSSTGQYTLLVSLTAESQQDARLNARKVCEAFREAAADGLHSGLEVRCGGHTVLGWDRV